jgi:DNA-directed RNA polymerase specialized sigma24 family protein
LFEESNESYYNLLKDNSFEPSKMLFGNEDENDVIKRIKGRLSKTENIIFDLKMKGLKNSEISDLLGKNKKYIENTLNRINRKYKDLFQNK